MRPVEAGGSAFRATLRPLRREKSDVTARDGTGGHFRAATGRRPGRRLRPITSPPSSGGYGDAAPREPPGGTEDEEDDVAETYNGYCVKCREKRDFEGEVSVSDSGRRMAKGKCPVCGTTMNRILGKA